MKRLAMMVVIVGFLGACGDEAPVDLLPTVEALSPDTARHSHHAYTADGSRVAYWAPSSNLSNSWQLWVASGDLTSPEALPVIAFAPVTPLWSPDGSRLAAVSSEFGLYDVVVVTIATKAVMRATKGQGVELPVGWARGGELLKFFGTSANGSFESGVVVMSTGEVRRLVPEETRPYLGGFSPDGSRIAYFTLDDSKSTIWLADSLGENRRQLTTEGYESLEQFNEWSPDGKSLLYRSTRTGTSDLWILPVDSGAPRQLTRNVRNETFGAWSPDGKWVAFLSDRGKQTDVWLVSADGGEERRVTNSADVEVRPQWRSANALAFEVVSERSSVWAIDLASGTERQLTPDSLAIARFNPSPNGEQLLYLIDRGGGVRDLAVGPMAGGALRVILSEADGILDPIWSPDGTKIAYASTRSGNSDLWVVDVAGGAPRNVLNWPSAEICPTWTTDGAKLLFISDRETTLGDAWVVDATGGEPTRLTRNGTLGCLYSRFGTETLFTESVSSRGGQLGLLSMRPDGTLQAVWDRSNAFLDAIFPMGDSIVAMVEQPDGKQRSMILSSAGRGGRVILDFGDDVTHASPDGGSLLYATTVGGATEVNLFTLSTGTKRRLTTTPESENGAEFSPDGKSVIFRRARITQRAYSVDVSGLLKGQTP